MTEWYYADAQQQRHGPMPADEIRQLFRNGALGLTSLVWREGFSQWKQLSEVADELQLQNLVASTTQAAEGGGIDLRADYTAIDNGTAPLPGTGGGTYSPYDAPSASVGGPQAGVLGGPVVYGGLWRRFAASVIDSLVTGIASYIVLIPLMLVFGISLSSFAENEFAGAGASIGFTIANYAISIFLPALYFGWMHSSNSMASLGKMAVGIKVVRSTGESISFWRSFLRYIAYIAFVALTCGLGLLISALMVALTERKQGLHDLACDTIVVDKWAFTENPEWQQEGLGVVTIVVLSLVGLMFAGVILLAVIGIGFASSNFS